MTQVLQTQVCVAGGGPAGIVHALLLARAGINVTVLEKHNDFLRDFRGDTVHPSTLRVMDELGLIDEFLRLPHTKVTRLALQNAASVAGLLLTTEVMIAEAPKDEEHSHGGMPPGGMGGMDM